MIYNSTRRCEGDTYEAHIPKMGCLHSQTSGSSPMLKVPKKSVRDAPVISEYSEPADDPESESLRIVYKRNGSSAARAIANGYICPYCKRGSPDYFLCCGHCYHKECAKENYRRTQRCCTCKYDYLDDVAPVLFEEDSPNYAAPITVEQIQQVNECPICFYEILKNDLKKLPCGHRLHQICFEQLLEYQNKCPMCRSRMSG